MSISVELVRLDSEPPPGGRGPGADYAPSVGRCAVNFQPEGKQSP